MRLSHPYTRSMQAAAFFDLDRTLLRRSSALALAGAFREHGVIGRGQLAKAAAWQLLFAARGASAETVRKAAEDGLMILKGFAVDDLRRLVAGRDGAGPEAARLPGGARARRSGTASAASRSTSSRPRCRRSSRSWRDELGFDGAIGSTCEIEDGVYTGRSLRACHGEGKAAALRELADEHGYDLAASTAYSDSHTDLPFLEAVGNPVVVNPDRELRADRGGARLAGARRSPSSRIRSARRLRPALLGIPLVLGAGAAVWAARRRAA